VHIERPLRLGCTDDGYHRRDLSRCYQRGERHAAALVTFGELRVPVSYS
jgi:hypothetical protein